MDSTANLLKEGMDFKDKKKSKEKMVFTLE
jgi:hypothetical protein